MYLHEINIGNVKLENNILLAPMAGITDLPFRLICEKFNPGLVTTEMVSAKAIYYNDEKTKKLINTENEKRPVAIQIFGNDEISIGYAAKYLSEHTEIIDINMGCPAPKVVKNGEGSKLLLDLDKARKIIKTVVKNSKVPVTLKIRIGWDRNHIVAEDIAKIAESEGISAITVHGRTRTEFFSGDIDFEQIKKVKESVKIPVIGNGNINNEYTAKEMFEKTGVDGIMIGRGAIGNPWIFKKIIHYLKTGTFLQDISLQEKLDIIKEHFSLLIKQKGEYTAVREFRKYLAYYTKNLPASSTFRNKINSLEQKDEVIKEIEKYFVEMGTLYFSAEINK